jgi:hypothetical protein
MGISLSRVASATPTSSIVEGAPLMPKRRWRSHFNLAFQLVEECFGFLEIDGIRAFGELRPAPLAYRGC